MKKDFLIFVVLALSFLSIVRNNHIYSGYFSVYNKDSQFFVHNVYDKDAVAVALYKEGFKAQGWGEISITTNKDYADKTQTYAAGFLEGYVTYDQIYNHYRNIKKADWENKEIPENVSSFLNKNHEYIMSMEKKLLRSAVDTDYITAVVNFYYQFLGIVDGYNARVQSEEGFPVLSRNDIHLMNSFGDLMEIVYYQADLPDFEKMSVQELLDHHRKKSHCSALIKIKEDFSDLFFGHNSWEPYHHGLRMLKTYEFNFNTKQKVAKKTIFSSYPATISSVDDFYITSEDMVIIETTNPVLKAELYKKLSPETLMTWLRVLVSNHLSSDSETWTKTFVKNNSGTYNNQFMILDLKNVDIKNKIILDKTLMIVEQIPGDYEIQDVTKFLKHGYWNSYNIPFSERIRQLSGYEDALSRYSTKKTGFLQNLDEDFDNLDEDFDNLDLNSSLDYYSNARASLFRRYASTIHSLDDFKKVIRYNDYKNEPLSLGRPGFSISSRYELEEEEKKRFCFGALDAKVASLTEVKDKENKIIHAILGPTSDDLPPMEWSKIDVCGNMAPFGMRDLFSYDWITFSSRTP